jgi:HEAT repeat protein
MRRQSHLIPVCACLLAGAFFCAPAAAAPAEATAAASEGEKDKLPFPSSLLKDLESPDSGTRLSAIQAIKPFSELTSFDTLVKLAGRDPVPEVRAQAVGALWNRGDRRAAHSLEVILNIDNDLAVKMATAGALGSVGLKTSVPYLVSAMSNTRDPSLLARCIRSIGELGDSASAPAVIPYLDLSWPWVVRGTAAVALGMLVSEKGADPLSGTLAKDPEPSVRAQAAEALGRLRAPATQDALTTALLFDKFPTVRHHAAAALTTFAHGEAVHAAFSRGIRDDDRRVRLMSLTGLVTRARKEDVIPLADLLTDESTVIRDLARDVLGKLGARTEKVGDVYRLVE